ncbi:transposase family protein [Streptomyces sp. NBC_01613]|uniref:transposase family protein n=1 Tax=Streptomyces sp. NBC_01613 TaxID=2975896 RepID=UPI00386DE015
MAEVADPCDPRGVRHRLTVVLTLTACAVLARATSLLAVGEWIADAPTYVLQQVGVRPDPLLPRRVLPAETTVRRLLAGIAGDALDRAIGRWLADRRPKPTGPSSCAAWPWNKACGVLPRRRTGRSICSPHWSTPPAWSLPSWTSARRATRSPASSRCWTSWPTLAGAVVTSDAMHTQRKQPIGQSVDGSARIYQTSSAFRT